MANRTVNDLGALALAEIRGREKFGATHRVIAAEMGRDPGVAESEAAEQSRLEHQRVVAAKEALKGAETAHAAKLAKAEADSAKKLAEREAATAAAHQAAEDYLGKAKIETAVAVALRERWQRVWAAVERELAS